MSDSKIKNKSCICYLILKLNLILVCFWFVISSFGFLYAQNEFELAESIPVETELQTSDLKRTFDVWKEMIKDAKSSICIETFYFADEKNQPLNDIISELKSSSERGVIVRIIVDSSFYSRNDKSVDSLEGYENISIRKIPLGNIAGGVMHAKYFITDKENVFLGSQNFDWRALIHIHEIGVRIKNKRLAETFTDLFEYDWKLCEGSIPFPDSKNIVSSADPVIIDSEKYGLIKIYPAFSPQKLIHGDMNSEETELAGILENTREKLLIQIYSFSPATNKEGYTYLKIDSLLRIAAGKGVKIKLLIPDWALRGKSTDFLKELSKVNNIEIKIISIPQFSGGFIPYSRVDHCKYFISDNDISWISTSNWEYSYFHNSRNATLIMENAKVNKELETVFYRSWNSPYSEFIEINKTYEPVKRN